MTAFSPGGEIANVVEGGEERAVGFALAEYTAVLMMRQGDENSGLL
jgi:hypothetical protein